MLTRKLIETAADHAGWNCIIEKSTCDKNKCYNINFNTDTHFGQDVQYDYTVKRLDDIVEEIHNTWEGYDPDQQAMYWVGSDGHGVNGAPYRLRDILSDMDEVEELLEKLYKELYNYSKNSQS